MLKLLLIAASFVVATAAPAPGLLHGAPAITSSSSSVVHNAVLAPAPAVLALPAPALSSTIVAAPALHGLSLGAGLHGSVLAAPALLHSGLVAGPALAPTLALGHGNGILAGGTLGLGLH